GSSNFLPAVPILPALRTRIRASQDCRMRGLRRVVTLSDNLCGCNGPAYNFYACTSSDARSRRRHPEPLGSQGGPVVQYRTFPTPAPPRLVDVWNDTFTGRGAALLPNSTLLERYVFGKQQFDPHGLILAFEEQTMVGFAHAGLTADPALADIGVI